MISINLTIFNKENLIGMILDGILQNMSDATKEIIFVIDGCTDRSEYVVRQRMEKESISTKFLYANNEFEVIANNKALKESSQPFCLIIQDDMLVQEKDFDLKMLSPFVFDDAFAATARTAHDNIIAQSGLVDHVNISGKETNLPKQVYSIRDSCNRGPLMLKKSLLEKLNFLDEIYAPLDFDDHDICMRAWKEYRAVSGAYMIDYRSDHEWGSTHRPEIGQFAYESWMKNEKILRERHYQALIGEKHGEERACPYVTLASLTSLHL